jgi:hypothetical protein
MATASARLCQQRPFRLLSRAGEEIQGRFSQGRQWPFGFCMVYTRSASLEAGLLDFAALEIGIDFDFVLCCVCQFFQSV